MIWAIAVQAPILFAEHLRTLDDRVADFVKDHLRQ
jgi:hypothetical protein